MIKFRPILKIVGMILLVVAILMMTALPFSLHYDSGDDKAILYSSLITFFVGLVLALTKMRPGEEIKKREGYLIVALGWLSMICFGTLPYLLSGEIPSITNAFFETMSGMTTTGASIINDIEALPKGILYWRSLTQWIGGMGIIVLTIAIYPLLGFGGIELFVAEAPGPRSDKIHPRIQETAKRLWVLYVLLTILLGIILRFCGMTFFDAVNHALTTMATGGFSTKNASMMYYDTPIIQYPIILFMFIAGTNYTVIYFGLTGRFKRVLQNDEFKTYVTIVLLSVMILSLIVYQYNDSSFEKAFRDTLFQIVSLITTTGFVSADYTSWGSLLLLFFFFLMFIGASAGSTSGGIKLIRHLVFFKNSFLEFKRIIHPRAIVPLKISGTVVAPRIMTHILVFLLLYLMLFIIGTFIVAALGLDFMTAIGAVATSLGNVGPGIGDVGPLNNFSALSDPIKWVLCFFMLAGRLELFTILVLFMPYFWKSN
jgi:trk system potassium uptake protein TrkH